MHHDDKAKTEILLACVLALKHVLVPMLLYTELFYV